MSSLSIVWFFRGLGAFVCLGVGGDVWGFFLFSWGFGSFFCVWWFVCWGFWWFGFLLLFFLLLSFCFFGFVVLVWVFFFLPLPHWKQTYFILFHSATHELPNPLGWPTPFHIKVFVWLILLDLSFSLPKWRQRGCTMLRISKIVMPTQLDIKA